MKHTACLVAVLCAGVGTPALAQLNYLPGQYHYKQSTVSTTTTEIMGQTNTQSTTIDQLLTVSLTAKGRDTLQFKMTIDSVNVTSPDGGGVFNFGGRGGGGAGGGNAGGGGAGGGNAGGGAAGAANGGRVVTRRAGGAGGGAAGGGLGLLGGLGGIGGANATPGEIMSALISPKGHLYEMADGGAAGQALRQFLTPLPPVVKAGVTWTDTLPPPQPGAGGASITGQTIAQGEIISDTAYMGERAWKVKRTLSITLDISGGGMAIIGGGGGGGGGAGGGGASIQAEGTGDGIYYVSTKGVLLGGSDTMNLEMSISIGQSGMQIPISIKTQNTTAIVR